MKNNNVLHVMEGKYSSVIKTLSIKRSIYLVLISACGLSFSGLSNAADLEKLLFSKLPSDKVQINLTSSDGSFPEPKVFKTQNPARVVFDFYGLKSKLQKTDFVVSKGAVDTLKVVEVADRTRLVMNLTSVVPYKVSKENGQYIILVGAETNKLATKSLPKGFAKQPEIINDSKVKGIDFRRTNNAGGKVIINLSDPQTTVTVGQKDGEVVVNFKDTSIDSALEKRLDVTDFATTVSSIDTFQNGDNVTMVISPTGEYQQISFQNGDIFTVILDPIDDSVVEEVAEVDENGYSGERLSLNFQRLEVRSALSVISDFTGLNIIASDDVEGELTLNLKDVPWDQALDVILETRGLAKRQKGNVVWVAPARRIAEFEKEQLEAAQASAALEPLISEVIAINYARAEDLRDVILDETEDDNGNSNNNDDDEPRSVVFLQQTESGTTEVSGGDGGASSLRITADERTNSLVVTTSVSNMVSVKALISELDRPVRQVMVETRIVDASDTFSRELGAKLGFTRLTENARGLGSGSNLGNTAVSGGLGGTDAAQQSLLDGNSIFASNDPQNLNVDLGANGIGDQAPGAFAFSLFRAGTGFANLINLELSALEAEGQGKIVSSPRLVTSNQQTATISTGTTVFVTTGISDDGVPITETRDALLSLEVTPQISPDDNIILDVVVSQDFFIDTDTIRTNDIVTQVTVENGETIVIGGIYQEQQVSSVTKIPFLGDIPYLGNLFKTKSKSSNRTELLIFLTPKIIDQAVDLN